MNDFVTMSCPKCGGRLEITRDIERFACSFCGTEHIVIRGGGIVSLAPLIEEAKGIRTGVDKTASELAIKRLEYEIAEQRKNIQNIRFQEKFKSNPLYILLLVGGILLLLIGCPSFIDNGASVGVIIAFCVVGLFFMGLGAYAIKQESKEFQEHNRLLEEKLIPYKAELEMKEKDLQYHRMIVGTH